MVINEGITWSYISISSGRFLPFSSEKWQKGTIHGPMTVGHTEAVVNAIWLPECDHLTMGEKSEADKTSMVRCKYFF